MRVYLRKRELMGHELVEVVDKRRARDVTKVWLRSHTIVCVNKGM